MGLGSLLYRIRMAAAFQGALARARVNWRRISFVGSPVVFGNAIPKSGSNLLRQILGGLQLVAPFEPVRKFPIRTVTIDGRVRQTQEVEDELSRLHPGSVGWGYLPSTEPYPSVLGQSTWASFCLIRDPRDLLVSHVFYATEMSETHSMRPIYAALPDFESRLLVAIQGTKEYPFLPSVRTSYERYFGYLDNPDVFLLRFEDLRLDPGAQVSRMLTWIAQRGGLDIPASPDSVSAILKGTSPGGSNTFRKGSVGEWKRHFTPGAKRMFDDVAGDLLQVLGYPPDPEWEALS